MCNLGNINVATASILEVQRSEKMMRVQVLKLVFVATLKLHEVMSKDHEQYVLYTSYTVIRCLQNSKDASRSPLGVDNVD